MDISIIIVSWNARRFLEQCLTSLLHAPMKYTAEIIVVDNDSADGSPDLVATRFPEVKLIRNSHNLGFAKANNIGIRESKGRYVGLINSDVKILGDCLDALIDFMDEHQEVGNVGPRILNGDLSLQCSCRRFPTLWNTFCEATGLARVFASSRFLSGQQMSSFSHDRFKEVDVLVGCFWLMRREALDTVGLLDEDFFIYSEDVDWCTRAWKTGWHIAFAPVGQAVHYREGSSANDPARFAVAQQRAVLHYWSKHRGRFGCLGIRAILFSRQLSRYLFGIAARCLGCSTTKNNTRIAVRGACVRALMFGAGHRAGD
jgi:GT2 family glycosyltransferase